MISLGNSNRSLSAMVVAIGGLLVMAALILYGTGARAQNGVIPLGTYTAVASDITVVSPLVQPGEFRITLNDGGTYAYSYNLRILITGTYAFNGDHLEFTMSWGQVIA
ncbi:MAG: hypothetical protein IPJ07_22205 [Acidobacteria bacterium]|nr:hypothetical protein [Acidobacteriota bacterium]